jgi:hypothetical protein
MNFTRRAATISGLGLLASTAMGTIAGAEIGEGIRDLAEGLDDFALATDAYVFGYPLVTMEMTRRVITNAAKVEGSHGPMGQMIKLRQYPDASYRDVTAPNADTLYTTAFIDVGKEPWVLSIPDMKDRYFLFPMLDGWTTVFQVPGKRTTGTGAQTYAITGPGWTGTLPAGVKEYKSQTSIVWILGRIYCTGTPEDYAAVHALQDQCQLYPLSSYGKPYTLRWAPSNLISNPDGSTDLYIQKDSPGAGKEANWLPAPSGKFQLMLRMYWPKEEDPSILNDTWKVPVVSKVTA